MRRQTLRLPFSDARRGGLPRQTGTSGREMAGWFDLVFMLGHPVWEATLGLVGFGRIGRAMATRAGGFRMRTIYHDFDRASPDEERGLNMEYREFDDLLANPIM